MTPEEILATDKTYIMGVDEVGVGCIAGPTYICAFKAPKAWFLKGVRDSKKIAEKKRETLSALIREDQSIYGYSIQIGSSHSIDSHGIKQTIHQCYFDAVMELGVQDTLIVVDGLRFKEERYEYQALVGGDDLVPHISAASILAKVARDHFMKDQHVLHPEYNWAQNKGYDTPQHRSGLGLHGPAPQHRRSFEPIKSMVAK